jgi:hypothetical protein
MAAVKPIRPKEVSRKKKASIPYAVFEAFNELVTENYDPNSRCAIVRQDDVVNRIVQKEHSRKEVFDKGWLDIEEIYAKHGWKVEYDSPAYNESYPSTFRFQAR